MRNDAVDVHTSLSSRICERQTTPRLWLHKRIRMRLSGVPGFPSPTTCKRARQRCSRYCCCRRRDLLWVRTRVAYTSPKTATKVAETAVVGSLSNQIRTKHTSITVRLKSIYHSHALLRKWCVRCSLFTSLLIEKVWRRQRH